MKIFHPSMDSVHCEVKYVYGNLYFDRCGQCLNDIERGCEGWYVTSANTNTGILEKPEKSFSLNFNNERFNFSAQKTSNTDINTIAKEASILWKIIGANLGLDEYTRQGCRIYYLVGTETLEDAEKLIEKASLNVIIPKKLMESGFKRKNTNLIVIFNKGNIEYRLQLSAITRYEAINPDNLIRTDPRMLSTRQKQIRLAKFKQLAEYSANPMYAVSLDVDCYEVKPDRISIEEFILEQADIVKSEFLPILEK